MQIDSSFIPRSCDHLLAYGHSLAIALCISVLAAALLACGGGGGGGSGGGGGGGSQQGLNQDPPPAPENPPPAPENPPPEPAAVFETISDEDWDQTAVRKVLRTFAYGGHTSDEQIASWAAMHPEDAIREMLTFEQHNLLLSKVNPADNDNLAAREGTWEGLSAFWSSSDPENPVYVPYRNRYLPGSLIDHIWVRAATSRGLNPFRQKIGLWETNYHMAINTEFVSKIQVPKYYDDICNALEAAEPYQDVISVAAKSAAIATQYGHKDNVYIDGQCYCNEDFAREYYQLFFGINSEDEFDYHETVTIKNMASALTDMFVPRDTIVGGYSDTVVFGSDKHYPGVLEMLHSSIGGQNAAQRIDQLSQVAIEDDDSLDNLPVMIIRGLADDNLDSLGIETIRNAWKSLPEKNLLEFLRAYAISKLFHSSKRVKYHDSVDRHIFTINQFLLSNTEGFLDLVNVFDYELEDVELFQPKHNVFGAQTGIEAAESADIFRIQYNRSTERYLNYYTASGERYGQQWVKDWAAEIPVNEGEPYRVKDVAEWLWNRFIVDGLKNFGLLERAHVYAILATGYDINYLADPSRLDRVIDTTALETDPDLTNLIAGLEITNIPLDSNEEPERLSANRRVGQAINFIVATPYIFAQEGK